MDLAASPPSRHEGAGKTPFGLVDLAAHLGPTYIWSTDLSAPLPMRVAFGFFAFGVNVCVWRQSNK